MWLKPNVVKAGLHFMERKMSEKSVRDLIWGKNFSNFQSLTDSRTESRAAEKTPLPMGSPMAFWPQQG